MATKIIRYKLVFFVPEAHAETVKEALFKAGAGRYDSYDSCSWQTLGQGQIKPLENSEPFIGKKGEIEHVAEYRVEMVCNDDDIKHVLSTLVSVHPYEVPAYEVWPIMTLDDF